MLLVSTETSFQKLSYPSEGIYFSQSNVELQIGPFPAGCSHSRCSVGSDPGILNSIDCKPEPPTLNPQP